MMKYCVIDFELEFGKFKERERMMDARNGE